MYNVQPRPVKTGSDPRTLPDFIALREEMAKLTHPARPDVNWQQAEALSLSLFEINGVELQTAAWYTLARSHLARVSGMNEGLAIINALLSHQWTQLWPQPVHARAEILNGLFQRLHKVFRTFTLSAGDRASLEQAEQQLTMLNAILARQELKHACQTAPLLQQVHNALIRLENGSSAEPAIALPVQALAATPSQESASGVSRLVYVIRPEPEVRVDVIHETLPPPKRWPVFVAGVCSTLAIGAMALWGWSYVHRVDEAYQALTASVAPLPQALDAGQIQALRRSNDAQRDPAEWLNNAAKQLDALAALPPEWTFRYGNALVAQAQALWPEKTEVMEMQKRWQQQLAVSTLPASALTGWHEGMQQLQALADQLNALDGQKGKYITVSELKSSVFQMMTNFRQTVPLEEQLRQAASPSMQEDEKVALNKKIQDHLKGLAVMASD